MISYSHFIILFEGKASDLRSKYPHLSHLTDKHLVKYGEALGKMPDLPSDASKLTSVLSSFDTHGSKLDQKDFHKYDSFVSVEQSLRPHLERAEKSKKLSDESPVVFKGDNTTVRHIKTYEAASSGPYCKNTKWCVTGSDSRGYQHWNHYSRGGANRMYVINTPEGKYAYHEGESGIARDAADYGIELDHLVKKYPELKKSEELKGSKYGHIFGNDKLNDRLVRDLGEYDRMELIQKYPKHADHFYNDQSWIVRSEVAKHPEHAGKLANDQSWIVRSEVAKHPEHAGKLINDRYDTVRLEVAKHPEHAGKLINDPEILVRYEVAKHPKHAGKLINDPSPVVANQAKSTMKAKATEDQLYKDLIGMGSDN
jgi:hypothetical protein